MSLALYRLGHLVGRHRLLVVGVWAVVLLTLLGLARAGGGTFEDDFTIPGTESERGMDVLAERFGSAAAGATAQVLYRGEDLTEPGAAAVVEESLAAIADVDGVAAVTAAEGLRTDGSGGAALASVQLEDAEPDDATTDALRAAAAVDAGGVTSTVGGNAFSSGTGAPAGHTAELVGLAVALVVLAVTFGSLVAAGVPVVTALLGVGGSALALQLAASAATISTSTPTFAAMLGLAVGIDYALFVLSRHRAQLADGHDPRESMARALGTAGSAVVFAGATVVVSLVGLVVVGIPVLSWMGLGGALAVTLAVASALTLLPALALLLGERLRPRPRPARLARRPRTTQRTSVAQRWVRAVTRLPVLTVVLVVGGLGVLALPAADLQLALPGASGGEPGTPQREHADAVADAFGPGYGSPLIVTADILTSDDPRDTVEELADAIGDVEGVVEVTTATPNRSADTALVRIVPPGGQSDPATVDLVHRLREEAPAIEAQTGVDDILVTGSTAVTIDVQELLSAAVLPFGATVVGLSLVLLTIVFRSVAVPVKATAGFVLSVGAALGAIVAVFQWGWGADLLGVTEPGPVVSFLPILVIGVLFGLAMDYEMFLVSRMREEYTHHGDARDAVRTGFAHSAPVVTSAALIMVAVFAAFVPEGSATLKPIAFGLAVGVLVDAFVVRMTLVPAVLVLLGRHAWWMPARLGRLLPSVDVEGEAVTRALAAARAATAPDAPAVQARGLVARPGDAPLDVDAADGAVTVVPVVGDAAATVVARALTGRSAAAGTVAVHGAVLPEQRERVRRSTAVVPTDPPLHGRTVEEHTRRALARLGAPRRRRAELVARVGQITGLHGPADQLTRTGRRLLAAAVAHVVGARVVVLPGPDDTALAETLVRHGATVVVVTADPGAPGALPTPATTPVALEAAHR